MLGIQNKIKEIKFRNPFPAIGKVFKYEMISISRMILPIYAVLLALSLVIGLFVINEELDFESAGSWGWIKLALIMLAVILFSIMIVILLSIISRRFKKSMLGDEAYLNLTLPVSIGEHLCGRYLADFVWGLSYALIAVLSVLFVLVRVWNKLPEAFSELLESSAKFKLEHGVGFGYIFCQSFIHLLLFYMLVCVAIYAIQSILHLIGKHRTLVSVLSFACIFTVYHNIGQFIFKGLFSDGDFVNTAFRTVLLLLDIYDLIWIFILLITTKLILTFKLNLE